MLQLQHLDYYLPLITFHVNPPFSDCPPLGLYQYKEEPKRASPDYGVITTEDWEKLASLGVEKTEQQEEAWKDGCLQYGNQLDY